MGSTRYIMSIGELTRKDNSLCFRKNGRNVYIPVENTKRKVSYRTALKLDCYKLIKNILEEKEFVPFSLKEGM